jgi:DNA-directed RNA polymerase subunit L
MTNLPRRLDGKPMSEMELDELFYAFKSENHTLESLAADCLLANDPAAAMALVPKIRHAREMMTKARIAMEEEDARWFCIHERNRELRIKHEDPE